jgi:phosphoglycerate dehydrogenase-like enzyme
LTPHIGGATEETVERQSEMIAEDILLAAHGRQPKRLVNPAVLKAPALRAKVKA